MTRARKVVRLCPVCGDRLANVGGRDFTTRDGRKVVALVWTHRTPRHGGAPRPACHATWPEEDVRAAKHVRREVTP